MPLFFDSLFSSVAFSHLSGDVFNRMDWSDNRIGSVPLPTRAHAEGKTEVKIAPTALIDREEVI
jgi:hypothetical protein